MPAALIETRCRRPAIDETEIIDAVHRALVDAFKIPTNDRGVRLVCHEPHRFACPPNRREPELFTLVTVDAFAGRSLDAKRSLYRAIVNNLGALGIPGDHITILWRESPQTNWGVRGGNAACDVDLGFAVEV